RAGHQRSPGSHRAPIPLLAARPPSDRKGRVMTTQTTWTGVVRQRPRRDFRRLREFAIRWGALLALGVVWEIAARLAGSIFFPPLSRIAARLVARWLSGPPASLFLTEGVATNIAPSLLRMLGGWSIAVILGVLLGVAIGRSKVLGDFVEPI